MTQSSYPKAKKILGMYVILDETMPEDEAILGTVDEWGQKLEQVNIIHLSPTNCEGREMNETEENLLAESRIRRFIAESEFCRNYCKRITATMCLTCSINETTATAPSIIRTSIPTTKEVET